MHLLAALGPFHATPLNTFAHFIRRVAKRKKYKRERRITFVTPKVLYPSNIGISIRRFLQCKYV